MERSWSTAVPRTPRSGASKTSHQEATTNAANNAWNGAPSTSASCHHRQEGFSTLVLYALGIIVCVFLLAHTMKAGPLPSSTARSTDWSRKSPYRGKYLDLQLIDKDEEISHLRTHLSEVLAGSRAADDNLKSLDNTIKELQLKHETERRAKERAQSAMGEHVAAVDKCVSMTGVMSSEAAACAREVNDLRAMLAGTWRAP